MCRFLGAGSSQIPFFLCLCSLPQTGIETVNLAFAFDKVNHSINSCSRILRSCGAYIIQLIVTLVIPEILLCLTSPTQRGHNNRPLKRLTRPHAGNTIHTQHIVQFFMYILHLGNAIPGLIPGLHRARLWLAIAGLVIGKIATRYRAVKLHVFSLAHGSF